MSDQDLDFNTASERIGCFSHLDATSEAWLLEMSILNCKRALIEHVIPAIDHGATIRFAWYIENQGMKKRASRELGFPKIEDVRKVGRDERMVVNIFVN